MLLQRPPREAQGGLSSVPELSLPPLLTAALPASRVPGPFWLGPPGSRTLPY